jgi:hypothetical protein
MQTEASFKRLRYGLLAALAILSAAAAYGGIWLLRDSCDCPPGIKAAQVSVSIVVLAIPALIASFFVWRRIHKGSFLTSYEEYAQATEQAKLIRRKPLSLGWRIGVTACWIATIGLWVWSSIHRLHQHRDPRWALTAVWIGVAALNTWTFLRRQSCALPESTDMPSIAPPAAG